VKKKTRKVSKKAALSEEVYGFQGAEGGKEPLETTEMKTEKGPRGGTQ